MRHSFVGLPALMFTIISLPTAYLYRLRMRDATRIVTQSLNLVTPTLKCYFVINGEFTFDEAKQACEARNSHLATLHTPSEDQFIRSQIDWDAVPGFSRNLTWIGQLWIGLERISPEKWRWVDGSSLQFSSWLAGEGNTSRDDHECIITRKFGWINSYHCDATNGLMKYGVGALCQKNIFEAPPEASEAGANFCGSPLLPTTVNKFSMPTAAKKYYFTIKGPFGWDEAGRACTARSASLAILRTPHEDQFVRENIDLDAVGGNVWIGMRRVENHYQWIDNTSVRHGGWLPSEVIEQMPAVNNPNCTALKKWQNSPDDKYETIGWAAFECSSDSNSAKNWPESLFFPIGALCETVNWL